MILRTIEPADSPNTLSPSAPLPAWPAIEVTQKQKMTECWLITQPAHAALAGQIAGHLDSGAFPGIDETTIRAISLHDAGWGLLDAADIQSSRAGITRSANGFQPRSFITAPSSEIVRAWTGSISVAAKISPLGALIVSEHFRSIADSQLARQDRSKDSADFTLLKKFVDGEAARQKLLLKALSVPPAFLQRLVEALQFSDLLSLYICCGIQVSIEFQQKIRGENIKLIWDSQRTNCWLQPSPFVRECEFSISAIRHPKRKGSHGSTFSLTVR